MARAVEREFLAADAYSQWRRRVKSAEKSIRVYSPYFDDLVVKLLGNSKLPAKCLSVVTDLSPDSGTLTYRKQLLAIRRLLSRDVEVRSLPRLHSKVLLIDGTSVTVGSQNFTSYARKSKETTAVPVLDMAQSRFVETLERWYQAAELVDAELIDKILEELAAPLETARAAIEALSTVYGNVVADYRETQRMLEQRRLERHEAAARAAAAAAAMQRAAAASRYSAGQSVAYAELKEKLVCNYLGYWTLDAESGVDLTRWREVDDAGRLVDTISLKRLYFYPILLGSGMRMEFARVGKTRITYLSRGIRGSTVNIKGIRLGFVIALPHMEPDGANLAVTFSWPSEDQVDGYQLRLLFDGEHVERIGEGPTGRPRRLDLLTTLVQSTYGDPEAWDAVLQAVLAPKRLEGFLAEKNAHIFFPRDEWLRINLIKFLGTPVLLIK
ncbi:MAG: hypothetical protein FGM52_00920 [Mycobacterium sp.]|nr:hypothetical protein [Mycobacterium sp.]